MPTIGFVSTHSPTLCGLATFSASLHSELVTASGAEGRIVRVLEAAQPRPSQDVVAELVAGDPASVVRSAAALASCDAVIVQHEYGVYGGPDGDEVLDFLALVEAPTIVVLHTVLSEPTAHQHEVLNRVAALADAVVVMTRTARDRLDDLYDVDMRSVHVIPHGAPATARSASPLFRDAQPRILTWGLIGPGKGIEWGIRAMAQLQDLDPRPHYLVAGQTHPKVLAHEGEAYRLRLVDTIHELRLDHCVMLDNQYRHQAALADLVRTADVVLLPYDSTDQVTSGVLIEAVAAGKPVVATRFPHAVELLGAGGGILVPQEDPSAIAGALREVLAARALPRGSAAPVVGTAMLWPAVAARYSALMALLHSARSAA